MIIRSKDLHIEEEITDFLKVIEQDFAELGGGWPVIAPQVKSYFHDIFYTGLYEKYQQDVFKFKRAISLLPITVLRIFLLRDSSLALKIARKYHGLKINDDEIINFFLTVVEVLERKTCGDPFSLNKELLILGNKQVKKGLAGEWFIPKNDNERKEINSFSITLQSFVWSVQYDVFAYGVYWHGPYRLQDETLLLIKELFDFNLPFWEKVDYSKARIYYLFSQKGDMEVDVIGNLIYKTSIWENFLKAKIFLDDKEINSIMEIQRLDEYFSEARKKQVRVVEKLTPQEIIKKGIEIYHFMFRDFFSFYGKDWKPSPQINKRVKELGLYYWDKFNVSDDKMDREQTRRFLRKLYDPRNDFTG